MLDTEDDDAGAASDGRGGGGGGGGGGVRVVGVGAIDWTTACPMGLDAVVGIVMPGIMACWW